MNNNLPVILLRGLVLLPYNDLKLEFETNDSRNIVDVAEMFHDSNLLVVTQPDPYDVNPDINTLPKIGVVSKITHKMVLPNGKVRVIISGIKRTNVCEYINSSNNGILESIVSDIPSEEIEKIAETAIIRKVNRELDLYVRNVPYMGNSVMSSLSKISKLEMFTDVLAASLPISLDRLKDYLMEIKPSERARMILMDIYKEEELFNIEKNLDLKVQKQLDDTQKNYILKEKIRLMKEELGEISSFEEEVDELRKRLNNKVVPEKISKRITSEIDRYSSLTNESPEKNMIRNYIEWMLDLPWTETTKDNDDTIKARKILDDSHNGLDEVKTRIIEYLAVKKVTNSLKSPIICLVGPPGVGKTSLAVSISRALNRKFVKVSLGGISDESELLGHRRTYLGSCPGRIIESMKKAKANNPVFLIDEIDKMAETVKGDPASALLNILDPEQNKYFSDNYIEEEYDLSNVMFIATANYIDRIPEPLKDRLEIINVSGYTELEKLDITKKHLIPKVCSETGLEHKLKIKDDIILEIIRSYTKEAGVRELERIISLLARKVVTKIADNTFKNSDLNVYKKNILEYLGKPKYSIIKTSKNIGVVSGLAYTDCGGLTLPIEANYYKGTGNLILTGSLGDVMKESAQIALSYVKSNYKKFGIDYKMFTDYDIHIHALEGAIPKDGPSAGITLVTAIISSLTNMEVSNSIAFTGEISLHGDVLPIGGLKEKSLGAYRSNIKTIIYPEENVCDLDEIPDEVKNKITFIPVHNYSQIYKIIKETK